MFISVLAQLPMHCCKTRLLFPLNASPLQGMYPSPYSIHLPKIKQASSFYIIFAPFPIFNSSFHPPFFPVCKKPFAKKQKNFIFSPRTASRVNCKTRWKLLANCRSGTWKPMFLVRGRNRGVSSSCFLGKNSPIISTKLPKMPGYLFRFEVWCLQWDFVFPIPFSWCSPTMMGPHTAAVMMRIFKR